MEAASRSTRRTCSSCACTRRWPGSSAPAAPWPTSGCSTGWTSSVRGCRSGWADGRAARGPGVPGSCVGRRTYARRVDVLLGVLLGVVLTASALAVSRLAAPRRVLAPGEEGVRSALHAAAATLPHLRRGLTRESAGKAIGHLHALTQAAGVMIDADGEVLAADGLPAAGGLVAGLRAGRGRARAGALREHGRRAAGRAGRADRAPGGVLRHRAAAAPGGHAGGDRGRRVGLGPGRVVGAGGAGGAAGAGRAAGAARADLAALHLQRAGRGGELDPHAPRGGARAADRVRRVHPLRVPRQPLVRDARGRAALRREVPAARAGAVRRPARRARERRAGGADRGRPGPVDAAAGRERRAPRGRVRDRAVPRRDPRRRSRRRRRADRQGRRRGHDRRGGGGALEGRGAGIGLANVHARLQSTFGPEYGLEVESAPGAGTVVRMLVPKFRAGVRAA